MRHTSSLHFLIRHLIGALSGVLVLLWQSQAEISDLVLIQLALMTADSHTHPTLRPQLPPPIHFSRMRAFVTVTSITSP